MRLNLEGHVLGEASKDTQGIFQPVPAGDLSHQTIRRRERLLLQHVSASVNPAERSVAACERRPDAAACRQDTRLGQDRQRLLGALIWVFGGKDIDRRLDNEDKTPEQSLAI